MDEARRRAGRPACSPPCGGSASSRSGSGQLDPRRTRSHGLIHLSVGQEGVAAGRLRAAARRRRTSTPATARTGTRSRRARPLDRVMAELMGRDGGLCRGLGGSMHLVDVEHGFMGATGVVGGNVPIALGSALAARLRGARPGRGRLLRRRRGPGRPLQRDGQPRDALAAAADPRLREQRLRRVHAALRAHEASSASATSSRPTTSSALTVDGNDVVATWEAFGASSRSARAGGGPFLLECLTHRLRGHYEGDPAAVPRGARGRGVAGEGPDPPARAARRRRGLVRRGRAARDRGGGGARRSRRRCASAVRARSRPPSSPRRWCTRMAETTTSPPSTATLAEAMRADERVLVLGEDVAEGGPYTATAGLAEEFGIRAGDQHADQRGGDLRRRHRRRAVGPAPGARDHVRRLPDARARPARQRGRQGALHVRRPAHGAARRCARRAARASAAPRSTRRASRAGSPTCRG